MAGSLIKLEEVTVSSATANVTLGDDKWDTSYDVYMVKYNNVQPDTDAQNLNVRFTVSGTPDTSSNYDRAFLRLSTAESYGTLSSTDENKLRTSGQNSGTGTSETTNGILYLFNFNNASEYSYITSEETSFGADTNTRGNQGGGVLTVSQACDGIQFLFSSGNIDSGTFTLYGLKK
tara:strand:+ start:1179 stop:1706 length:528 start_codon:yes stop_codon:yes gene_type:complete